MTMRLQFEFSIQKIPAAYRLGTLSIIKEMVRTGSNQYYRYMFEENSKEMKPFAYASYIQNLEYKGYEIYGDKMYLTISSPSYEFIMYLMNGSQKKEIYDYKDYKLKLIHKRLLPKPPTFTEIVTFKTASPILIENKEGKPLLASNPYFEREFNYYANLIAKELNNRELYQPIQIINSTMNKVVIKENLHQSQNRNVFMTANHGVIQLKGHQEDLKMLYECGVGLRRSLGLGLLNVEEVTYL